MRRGAIALAALLCSLVRVGAAQAPPPIPPERLPIPLDAAAWRKLEERGSIIEGRATPGTSVKSILAIFVVDAPPERVFGVVTDNEHLEDFMPFVRQSDVRTGEDGALLNAQQIDLPWPVPDLNYEISVRKTVPAGTDPADPWQVLWKYVPGSGNIEDNRGSWTLFRYGAGDTLVVYDNLIDPGSWMPGWVQDWAARRAIPQVVEAVRKRATES